ncbi:MAG: LptF/LptG family permease [Phycisphaerales bacterium]
MSLLDRYIARQYLVNIVALLVILFCFVVTIDASLNLGRYWNLGSIAARAANQDTALHRLLATLALIADLWWPRLLSLFNFMLGLVLVGAMGFTCAQLVRHRELVALLASGQSLFRVARPILLVAVGMTALQALNQELVIPRIAHLLARDQGDVVRRAAPPGARQAPPTADGQGRLFYAAAFDADAGVLTDLYIWERDAEGRATRRLHANRAVWRDGGWDLEGSTALEAGAMGAPAPGPARLQTDLDPTVLSLRRATGFGQQLSWAQSREVLGRMERAGLGSEQARQNYDRIVRSSLGRYATMVCNLLTLCIAMSFFLTRVPGNMLTQALKAAPVGVIALVGGVLGTAAAIPRIPPQVSVFLPVLILAPVAIALIGRVRT